MKTHRYLYTVSTAAGQYCQAGPYTSYRAARAEIALRGGRVRLDREWMDLDGSTDYRLEVGQKGWALTRGEVRREPSSDSAAF